MSAQSDARSQFGTPGETIGNVDLTAFHNRDGQTAHNQLLELTGKGVNGAQSLRDALLARIQSPAYQYGSDGDSFYTAASRINMLRAVQNDYRDRALRQVERKYPGLSDAIRADKGNASAVRHGKSPRTAMDKILDLNK